MSAQIETVIKLAESGLKDVVLQSEDALYTERIASYWSNNQRVKPSLIIRPRTAEEVSLAFTILVGVPECTIAIRSGGHTVWSGASNIANGVTIDLGALNKITYDPDTGIASIQPGARWSDAYAELDKHGVVVAGGRDGDVGVGGYTLGGGISWFLPRVGFSCDQVINFEVVLANGKIVQANENENSDLYQVLKGASGNFGIVTRLDFATFVEPSLWGGVRITDKSTTQAQIEALVSFTANLHESPENYCGLLWTYQPCFKDIVCLNLMFNSRGVANPPAFKQWLDLPAIVDTTKTASMAVHAKDTEQPAGYYTTWINVLIKNDPATVAKVVELHAEAVGSLRSRSESGDYWTMALFQPLPRIIAEQGLERGGNVMGLDQVKEDALLFISGVHVKEEEMSGWGELICREWHAKIESFAREKGTHLNWLYLNYADKSQDPFRIAGRVNVDKIRTAAKKYDPDGIFQTRCPGGFRISRSSA